MMVEIITADQREAIELDNISRIAKHHNAQAEHYCRLVRIAAWKRYTKRMLLAAFAFLTVAAMFTGFTVAHLVTPWIGIPFAVIPLCVACVTFGVWLGRRAK